MTRKLNVLLMAVLVASLLFSCKRDPANQDVTPIDQGLSKIVDIGNAQISCKIYGQGFPLIMCMGYSGTMEMWQPDVVKKLSENFKVILFDYPGVGLSTTTDTALTMKSMAQDVGKMMNVLGIEKTHVLGWSMGTNVSQEIALAFPLLVEKLVLYAADCGDTLSIPPSDSVVQILQNAGASPDDLYKILFPPAWLATHNPVDYFPNMTYGPNPDAVEMQWKAFEKWLAPGGGTAYLLKDILQPTLLITGDDDICTPTANSIILKDSIPNSTLIEVHGAGHGLIYQEPEKFVNYVLTFLKDN